MIKPQSAVFILAVITATLLSPWGATSVAGSPWWGSDNPADGRSNACGPAEPIDVQQLGLQSLFKLLGKSLVGSQAPLITGPSETPHVAFYQWDGTLSIWDNATRKVTRQVVQGDATSVELVHPEPTADSWLLVASVFGPVVAESLITGERKGFDTGFERSIQALPWAFVSQPADLVSRSGSEIVVGNLDNVTLFGWDGKIMAVNEGPRGVTTRPIPFEYRGEPAILVMSGNPEGEGPSESTATAYRIVESPPSLLPLGFPYAFEPIWERSIDHGFTGPTTAYQSSDNQTRFLIPLRHHSAQDSPMGAGFVAINEDGTIAFEGPPGTSGMFAIGDRDAEQPIVATGYSNGEGSRITVRWLESPGGAILVMDADTGEILSNTTASGTVGQVVLCDLDGDGREELISTEFRQRESPYDGSRTLGWGRLVIRDLLGSELWNHTFVDGYPLYLAVADATGDGDYEIVVGTKVDFGYIFDDDADAGQRYPMEWSRLHASRVLSDAEYDAVREHFGYLSTSGEDDSTEEETPPVGVAAILAALGLLATSRRRMP